MIDSGNYLKIQKRLETDVFSVYHPNDSKETIQELTLKFYEIINDWHIPHGAGAIDIIDFVEDKLTVIRGFDIPFKWLECVYDAIKNQVDLKYRLAHVWSNMPTYFQQTNYIIHFVRYAFHGEYECMMYLDFLNRTHKAHIHESETVKVLHKYILCTIIRICEILCEDLEKDYKLSLEYMQDLETTPINDDKKMFFEERWCWITNKRLDTSQARLNGAASILKKHKDKYTEEWEEWKKASNRFYKIANKLAIIILNPDFKWVKKQKLDLYNSRKTPFNTLCQ
jgi:hypothetical protein